MLVATLYRDTLGPFLSLCLRKSLSENELFIIEWTMQHTYIRLKKKLREERERGEGEKVCKSIKPIRMIHIAI